MNHIVDEIVCGGPFSFDCHDGVAGTWAVILLIVVSAVAIIPVALAISDFLKGMYKKNGATDKERIITSLVAGFVSIFLYSVSFFITMAIFFGVFPIVIDFLIDNIVIAVILLAIVSYFTIYTNNEIKSYQAKK